MSLFGPDDRLLGLALSFLLYSRSLFGRRRVWLRFDDGGGHERTQRRYDLKRRVAKDVSLRVVGNIPHV
jgi:hypothetical protein